MTSAGGADAPDLLRRLFAVTSELSRARSVPQVADVLLTHGVSNPGAETLAVWLLDDDAAALRLAAATGMKEGVAETFATLPMEAPLPGPHVVRHGEALYIRSVVERDELWPVLVGTPSSSEALAVLPLHVDGRTIGCLALGFADVREFGDAERQFHAALADQCAQALERARLSDVEQQAAQRMTFLAEASAVLAGSLDVDVVLGRIAELVLGVLGSMCAVDLVGAGGRTRRVAMAHADPQSQEILALLREAPIQPGTSAYRALTDGATVALDEVTEERMRAATDDPAAYDLVKQLAIGPALLVPLRARGRTLGLLSVARPRGASLFSADDITLAEQLASRAAVAIDNARLYADRAAITKDLQAGLLPPALPAIPHVDLAARYRPAFEGLEVGGDFYDVFPVGERWAVMVGDVVGTGARAAATTAVVRHTARAVASRVSSPADVVLAIDEALRALDDDEAFCTLLYGELQVGDGGAELALVGAGHPHPMIRRAGGAVETVAAGGTLLGPFPAAPETTVLRLAPGDAFVAFTDGVIEARPGEGEPMFCEEGVEQVLASMEGDAAATALGVEDAVLTFCRGQASDDVAVLVLRVV